MKFLFEAHKKKAQEQTGGRSDNPSDRPGSQIKEATIK